MTRDSLPFCALIVLALIVGALLALVIIGTVIVAALLSEVRLPRRASKAVRA